MDEFLALALEEMNKNPAILKKMEKDFLKSMENNAIVFGKYSFRKHFDNTRPRSVINASLFDVFSFLFIKFDSHLANNKKNIFREKFYNLMNNKIFMDAITSGTSDVSKVKRRFNLAIGTKDC